MWEVIGADGGHIGVALERQQHMDVDALREHAAAAGLTPQETTDSRLRWGVPEVAGHISGGVMLGEGTDLLVLRVESSSDDLERVFRADAATRSAAFLERMGKVLVSGAPSLDGRR
ncbi:hypothetical protein [Aquipuribacter nitratireducens]|uniref:Uncharacterized protein n=1 Tax=Aquipuribacter nitratireducens TaxID=650104 RepID=A0ABW0GQL5_9MICO